MPIPNYSNPGVYVTQTGNSYVTPSTAALNLCIVTDTLVSGTGSDTFNTTGASGVNIGVLSNPLVNSGTITCYQTTATGTTFTAITGFQTQRCNSDGTLSASGIYTLITTSGITGTGTAVVSGQVTFSYQHSFGGNGSYANYNAVTSVFGSAVSGTTVVSPASLAAYLAYQNGANNVTILPVARASSYNGVTVTGTSAADADWLRTFTTSGTGTDVTVLSNKSPVDVIVPTYGFTAASGVQIATATVPSGITNYLAAQANNGVYQRVFAGIDGTSGLTPASGVVNLASGWSNSRISLVYPGVFSYNPGLNTTTQLTTTVINVAGYYGAAAVAGQFVGSPTVATPITNNQVFGFTGVPNQISQVDSTNIYQTNGLLVIRQRRDGNLYIQHGLTTNVSNWLTQEVSISAIGDYLANAVTNALNNGQVVGGPLNLYTFAGTQSIVVGVLNNALSNGIIQGFQNLAVTNSPSAPTTLNITFQYSPTFPLNYINVVMSLNASTGVLSTSNSLTSNVTTA